MTQDDGSVESRDPAPAITRGMRILGLLAEAGRPLSLTTIAHELGLAKSSTSNLCLALESAGMVQKGPTGYRLWRRAAELGGAFASQFNQVREFYSVCEADPVLAEEVVQIAMLDGTITLYIARYAGISSMRIGTPLGSRLPAALSATGNAILMTMTDADVEQLIAGTLPFPRLTERSIRTMDELYANLAAAREHGWAVDRGTSFPGVVGVSVPLESWEPADPKLALGVALPDAKATEEHIERVGKALVAAARQLANPLNPHKPQDP